MNPVNWYVRAFTPADTNFLDDAHPTEKMVLIFGFYGVLVALYSFVKWQGEAIGSLTATSAAMLIMVLVASALLKGRGSTVWAVNITLAAFTLHAVNMVVQTGGIASPHTYWLIANVVLVYFLADRRSAFIWALLNTGAVLALIAWQQSDTPLPVHDLSARTQAIDQWSGYLLPVLVVWLAQSINLSIRTAAQSLSQNALHQAQAHAAETAEHAEKLSRVLTEAGHSMNQMHEGGRHLGQLQQDVQTHGQTVQQQSEQLAEASTFFDQQLNTVSASLDESTTLVQDMQKEVSQASTTSGRSGEALEAVVQNMDKIKSNNDQIDRATRLINDIAEQTNLLALNAAIESARAGEAGRGFAVVADEVRNLSQKSDASANEIRQLLAQSTSDIDTGVSVVNTAHEALTGTLAAVNTVNRSIVELSERIAEQNRDLAEMARSSNDLAAISQRQKDAANALMTSQQALGEQANTLTELSERMQAAMQA